LKKIRFGILGCGRIADEFVSDLVYAKGCECVAVGSRGLKKGKAFADKFGISRAYGSYDQLVSDGDVDVVYVATPHPFHMENTLASVKAGKGVLCEKPVAVNAGQFRKMRSAAEKKGVFLMEAMWTRFFPAIKQIRKWLDEGKIGEVLEVKAEFGVHFKVDAKHRIHNRSLGGGGLLDLGIYPVSFASLVFGAQPSRIESVVHKERNGVDDQADMLFQYSGGASACLSCSTRFAMKQEAIVYGSKGMIIIEKDFFHPSQVVLQMEGKGAKVYEFGYEGNGLHFEAEHVGQCVSKGATESVLMSLDESMDIMKTMDRIRKGWKLKYPCEK